jgi:hypothetical protein
VGNFVVRRCSCHRCHFFGRVGCFFSIWELHCIALHCMYRTGESGNQWEQVRKLNSEGVEKVGVSLSIFSSLSLSLSSCLATIFHVIWYTRSSGFDGYAVLDRGLLCTYCHTGVQWRVCVSFQARVVNNQPIQSEGLRLDWLPNSGGEVGWLPQLGRIGWLVGGLPRMPF